MSQKSKQAVPLIVVLGETASGKTRLAIDLAKRLDGEIICADSWTVRRELNIGTDKPSKEQQRAVKHHLLDLVGPCEGFTAAVFKTLANQAIAEIGTKGKVPIMVGGSGLYVDGVIFDYGFLATSDPKQREALNSMSVDGLAEKIHELGLPIKEGIDLRNKRRLIRLIENNGVYPSRSDLRPNTLIIGLKLNEDELKEAIENRVDQMIAKGLEQEVRSLSSKYGWDCEALRGVGYKQWHGYFDGNQTLEETRKQIITATNNLAKKQRTWFKRNKSTHWFIQPVDIDKIVDLATTELAI